MRNSFFYLKGLHLYKLEEWSDIEQDITKLQNDNNNLKNDNDNFKGRNNIILAQIETLKKNNRNDLESVNERCKILQQYVDKSAQINKENEEKVFIIHIDFFSERGENHVNDKISKLD